MGFFEEYDTSSLNNEIEDVVFERLFRFIERRKEDPNFVQFCICQTCVLDITAIALNHLKPHYRMVSTNTPLAIKHVQIFDEEKINLEIMKAIEAVMASPHHY